jgi:hypothetical protein
MYTIKTTEEAHLLEDSQITTLSSDKFLNVLQVTIQFTIQCKNDYHNALIFFVKVIFLRTKLLN